MVPDLVVHRPEVLILVHATDGHGISKSHEHAVNNEHAVCNAPEDL
jgi:hypothetical protein